MTACRPPSRAAGGRQVMRDGMQGLSARSAFRTVDVARLALHFLPRGATLGNAGLLVAASGVTMLASEAVAALLGSVLAAVLL
ncbi:hypothetical protein AB0M46_27080 [Dactylosporangium sp. NPDC051485]|uniref:hypothetical protein n=1 Tax=Dactylosporangium sp. NPDC051485 TaxID=3154846 RepID=UPI00344A46F6